MHICHNEKTKVQTFIFSIVQERNSGMELYWEFVYFKVGRLVVQVLSELQTRSSDNL